MQGYDAVLKSITMRQMRDGYLSRLTGIEVVEWLACELPQVRTRRVDLLGRSADGRMVHLEFQSRNDPRMVLRMAEYSLAIRRRHGQFPRQIVLYVGRRSMRMEDRVSSDHFRFDCAIIDIREIDSKSLLESPNLGDNVLAVLTRLPSERDGFARY